MYVGDSATYIAIATTPFMRVVAATQRAAGRYKRLKPEDIAPALLKPELHFYVRDWGWGWGNAVETVVITNRQGKPAEKFASAVHPIVFEEVPESIRDLLDGSPDQRWRMAVFPLDLLNENRELHVVFRESIDVLNPDNTVRDYCVNCASSLKWRIVR
jgi:hypothetical protein